MQMPGKFTPFNLSACIDSLVGIYRISLVLEVACAQVPLWSLLLWEPGPWDTGVHQQLGQQLWHVGTEVLPFPALRDTSAFSCCNGFLKLAAHSALGFEQDISQLFNIKSQKKKKGSKAQKHPVNARLSLFYHLSRRAQHLF